MKKEQRCSCYPYTKLHSHVGWSFLANRTLAIDLTKLRLSLPCNHSCLRSRLADGKVGCKPRECVLGHTAPVAICLYCHWGCKPTLDLDIWGYWTAPSNSAAPPTTWRDSPQMTEVSKEVIVMSVTARESLWVAMDNCCHRYWEAL